MSKLPIEEIIFENRNKAYGAYIIRKSYSKTVTKALIYSGVFVTLLLLSPIIYKKINPPVFNIVKSTKVNVILDSPPPIDEKLIQTKFPQLPPPPKAIATIKIRVCNIDALEVSEEKPEEPKEDEPPIICKGFFEPRDTTVQECGVDIETEIIEKTDGVLLFAEQMPTFVGGKSELDKFLSKNLRYPPKATHSCVEGTVYVQFVVEEDGKLSQVTIIKGIGYGCDEEAERLINLMPKWIAGKQDEKSVAVRYCLPIRFK